MENYKPKFRPILFSTPMVQALDAGTKTQTRRIVKLPSYHPSRPEKQADKMDIKNGVVYDGNGEELGKLKCPYNIGDVLWVRETFHKNEAPALAGTFYYKALVDPSWKLKWTPSLFMPKEACRIFLKVKAIRVERLNAISSSDAQQEGLTENGEGFVERFQTLWESINGKGSWNKNPFVFIYDFERITKPSDFK